MGKSITVSLINMYCDIVKSKFKLKIEQAYANDSILRETIKLEIYMKYNMMNEFKEREKCYARIKELDNILSTVERNKDQLRPYPHKHHSVMFSESEKMFEELSEYKKIQKELDEICLQIKLANCPDEIKQIISSIK